MQLPGGHSQTLQQTRCRVLAARSAHIAVPAAISLRAATVCAL